MLISQRRSQFHRALIFTVVGILGILSGVAVAVPPSPVRSHLLTVRPAPATLDALVARSPVIVIGTVESLVHESRFAGYDQHGNVRTAAEQGLPPEADVAYFDYALRVEQVVKANGSVQVGQPVLLRLFSKDVPGLPSHDLEFPPSALGDRHLFFLDYNPDWRTYGIWFGPASRLIIDGPIVRQSDGKRTPVRYPHEMAPAEFLRAIRDVVERQQTP